MRLFLEGEDGKDARGRGARTCTLPLTTGNEVTLETDAPARPGEVKVRVDVETVGAGRPAAEQHDRDVRDGVEGGHLGAAGGPAAAVRAAGHLRRAGATTRASASRRCGCAAAGAAGGEAARSSTSSPST